MLKSKRPNTVNNLNLWKKKVLVIPENEIMQGGNRDDIVIPVMGPTGAGKSFFINSLLKHDSVVVGHSLDSCTVGLNPIVVDSTMVARGFPQLKGRRLILVDTPGFDDTVKDDSEILMRISSWLAQSYSNDMKLGGIIYLHDISQSRMTGTTRRNLKVFEKLCGKDAFKSIVLGTTKWNLVKRELGIARQTELQNKFWSEMIDGGSRLLAVDEESPWKLIDIILNSDTGTLLKIQNEIVECKKLIPETEAGKQLTYMFDEVVKMQKDVTPQPELPHQATEKVPSLKKKQSKMMWKEKLGKTDAPADEIFRDASSGDIVIPIMGPSGAGKSYFINSLLNRQEVEVGHELDSCTQALKPVIVDDQIITLRYPHLYGRRLIIVDTPAFDHTSVSDSEILGRISKWLAQSYVKEMKLGGVIYLYDISQGYISSDTRRNLKVFQKLCGKDAFKSIVLATTKWKTVPIEIGKSHEASLRDKFWKEMLEGGSTLLAIDENNPWQLVDSILSAIQSNMSLTIQNELVELKKRIPETEAGKALKYTIDDVLKMQNEGGVQSEELVPVFEAARRLMIPLSRKVIRFFNFN